jgi:hypothetical protein
MRAGPLSFLVTTQAPVGADQEDTRMFSQNTLIRMRRRTATTALGIVLALGACGAAQAGASHPSNPHGTRAQAQKPRPAGDYTRHTEVQRTQHGHTRNTTAVGPKGGTTTRDVVATHDHASGTWTKDATVDHTPPPAPPNGG